MKEHETIADIIAEIRALSNPISDGIIAINGRSIADRLEAALGREAGDAAKLREACANIAEYARSAMCHATDAHLLGYINQIEGWSKAALAAPPRNCDVGSAEEQAERFTKVCTANSKDGVRGLCSETCPFSRDYQGECALVWSQMPYEEGGDDGR